MAKIGIIGGSGVYKIEGIKNLKEAKVKTPFGEPSDVYRIGELNGVSVVFLPRHGSKHTKCPSEINYRANIFGMKKLGVERLISVSACGSLKEELKPMDFVLPDQFVDRTNSARDMTFFKGGIVAHVGMADPVCSELVRSIYDTARGLNLSIHLGGAYLNMEGPAFSTRAESNLYRSWGASIIGMTNMAEARLAREAEMCFATIAAVTDYDCWHESHEAVTVEMILGNLAKNADNAKLLLRECVAKISEKKTCSCSESLKYAIVTRKADISAKLKRGLAPLIGKYVGEYGI
ncbi:MAG: methylthioadenosine phosphorylase [Candidatus Omnitrophica bacterium CG1_02_44_16]|nr:MAG: methylthioadenosine phosphorylase [Candidatus Omnitrophica bacterium CG1_02_44_16]PIY83674.1 MAG: S-methyl-5'-thioadenosine phosphorylase [Candidatus Omnitrophica bacterium CG_4_10_14_0_8_um_filter_44_12]PIZ84428.1 MAG: S-methyl-5'-thioadenosine phosphorylase [Candidatus Omnitrophica bacterium CG_4_10_14_0_2_um_filter_44_9]